MPSVAEEQPLVTSSTAGKKRRRDEDLLFEKLGSYSATTPVVSPFGTTSAQHAQNFFAVIHSTNDRLIIHPDNADGSGLIGGGGDDGSGADFVLPAVARKILPLPAAKRMRIVEDEDPALPCQYQGQIQYQHQPQSNERHRGSRNSRSPPPRVLQDHTDAANRPQPARANSSMLLSPCHICHRRPTKKTDLDSFADCQGCGERTCFVCIRECSGWQMGAEEQRFRDDEDLLSEQEVLSRSLHMDDVGDISPQEDSNSNMMSKDSHRHDVRHRGSARGEEGWTSGGHRQMVCSRCCIEKGAEGDVVCLGCLSRMEAV
jgi:hypothetical protein